MQNKVNFYSQKMQKHNFSSGLNTPLFWDCEGDIIITGIYKIENLINHKCYVGQSVDINRRWNDHKRRYNIEEEMNYDYPIYRAFRKYGIENFSFVVLEECLQEELNEKEIYYIEKYNAFFNGYNQTFGGDGNIQKPKEDIIRIFELLLNTTLTHPEIAKECNVSRSLVQGINVGRIWHNKNFIYPLQQGANKSQNQKKSIKTKTNCHNHHKNAKKIKQKSPKRICPICGNDKNRTSKVCKNCAKNLYKSKNKPSKDELAITLQDIKNFEKIGKIYKVSGNCVRKWCKQYGLPYHTKDYQTAKDTIDLTKEKIIIHKIQMMDIETNIVLMIFDSASQAERYINKKSARRRIVEVCQGKRKTAYGYKWEYAN